MKKFFKKVFSVFTKAWFWWLLGTLVVSLLVWIFLPIDAVFRLLIILVLVVTWSAINIYLLNKEQQKRLAAAQAGEKVEQLSFSDEQIETAIKVLGSHFDKAVSLTGRGDNALPWYLVLGAEGSGRSSLLKKSGLPYPVANESYQQIVQSDDDLCQWWFSKQAVFMDTHSTLLTELREDSLQHRVWLRLIELLKEKRRFKPLDGIILCIDLHTLLHQSEEERANATHALRTRIQSFISKVGIQCPIYIYFTKCDLVAGFSEFFAHLNQQERSQIFGVTLPIMAGNSIKLFGKEYDKLLSNLNRQTIVSLQKEADPKKAALISNFPLQMVTFKDVIEKYLNAAFESNFYHSAVAVRSLFFTSAFQHGDAIDYLGETTSFTFGLEVLNSKQKQTEHSFFIKDSFLSYVFPEKKLRLFNGLQMIRQFRFRMGIYIAIGALALLMVSLWINSYIQNRDRLQKVNANIQAFFQESKNITVANKNLMNVLPLLNDLNSIQSAYDPENDSLIVKFGLYQGRKIDEVSQNVYLQNLAIYFVPYVISVVTDELQDPDVPANQLYNALRAYLMLGEPDKLDKDFMFEWLNTYWQIKYKDQPDTLASLSENLSAMLSLPLKPVDLNESLIKTARSRLSQTTPAQREYFALQELAEISSYQKLYISNGVDSDFNQVFGANAAKLNVPALYTYNGYNNLYEAQLENVLNDERYTDWVLGASESKTIDSNSDHDLIAKQVTSMYMRDYISHWNSLLFSLNIVPFNTLAQASNVLSIVSGANSPIYNVLQTVTDNTTLTEDQTAGSSGGGLASAQKHMKANQALVKAIQPKALQSVTSKGKQFTPKYGKNTSAAGGSGAVEKTPVDIAFAPIDNLLQAPAVAATGKDNSGVAAPAAPIDAIMANLVKLNDLIAGIQDASNPNEAAYNFVIQRMADTTGADPLTQLMQQASVAPEPLRTWLTAIGNSTWNALLTGSLAYINQQYQQQVLPAYNSNIVGRYPFYQKSTNVISLADFSQFFDVTGSFNTFFTKYLAPFIDTTQATWKLKVIQGQKLPLSTGALAQIQQVAQIRSALLPKPGESPQVTFTLNIKTLSPTLASSLLTIGSDTVSYQHGPKQAQNFVWSGAGQQNYSLVLTDLSGGTQRYQAQGAWGLFQLFDQASVQANANSTDIVLTYNWAGKQMSYLLSVNGQANPFAPNMLHNFRLPAELKS
jgi:type VI secretion system protein ImpL